MAESTMDRNLPEGGREGGREDIWKAETRDSVQPPSMLTAATRFVVCNSWAGLQTSRESPAWLSVGNLSVLLVLS
jgi:hypothetical protein